ncbi:MULTISPECIES: carboxypeptidase-like regulatory domain-containing protein [Tenacibaculum]|uniref:carboxypeptidase-like regulatory domain-containing protein n=1 Tax=Tenacibaculum TaxID=104267 RepID=UPI001F0B6B9F|nr:MULTISPECIES: carboxypeptidase-like regulatory domain-containing protein [Tenacibaculum]MCH3881473.1 TonB-dependent receptor [Tenacibaculum aquimarinum]MDO6598933.1 carboxypeptidase-like regulatory domain-containing protein [Tenacibaculum sp. 1_MG-2023]
MRKFMFSVFLGALCLSATAQNTVKGIILDNNSEKPLQDVLVRINENTIKTTNGIFQLQNLPNGEHLLVITKKGYETQKYPIKLSGKTIDLGTIMLYLDVLEVQDLSTITISDDELNDDASAADNISGLLQSSRDVYLKTAAFEWSSSFYKVRGLGSENGKLLINGLEMNKLYNGRPQWSNWGGLNDVLRNQELSNFLTPSSHTFGGVLGTTNINVRASEARPGSRITYSSSNRSYSNRIMASYASGVNKNGWAFTFSAGRRFGNDGFVDATSYNANSFFASVEKKLNEKHSINFTGIYAQNKRGKSSPNTQEVFDLRGIKYNAYWGFQNGEKRNSRLKRIEEPILMLNHYWKISDKTTLNTNISYQFGEIGNSRLDYNGSTFDSNIVDGNGDPYILDLGGANPDPTYYQKLPSYGLRESFSNVYEMEQEFLNNGQINWNDLYAANANGNSAYVLYEDRNDDKQITINTIFSTELSDNITFNGAVNYKKLKSENFANVLDLLGGNGYLDVDTFADSFDGKQNNLLNPLHIAEVGDTFKYNFNLTSSVLSAFGQAQFKYNKIDYYVAGNVSQTKHQREGLFQNGGFSKNSLGKSEEQSFTNFGVKGGLTYKITGRHLIDFNAAFISKAPTLQNTFSNSRENNNVVDNLQSEKLISVDASYILRTPIVQAKLTGFYAKTDDATEISFFFADGIGGDNTAFVQEILSDISKKRFGAELGIEVNITPTITLKGAANFGQYTYDNNPNLYLTTENNEDSKSAGFINGRKDLGKANLKDYKLAVGPQRAYSIGFDYRDPDYWFFGATANLLSNTYVDVAPLTRTSNFADDGGTPFNDYDETIARQLLQQEKFEDYTVINAVGGKSWRVGNQKYIGFFASIGNIFDTKYKSGGFEQGRNANYRQLRDDKALEKQVFGNKYWYGRGTTYFLNVNYRF